MKLGTWRVLLLMLVAACSSTKDDGSSGSAPTSDTPPADPPAPPAPGTAQVDPAKDGDPNAPWAPPVETGAVTFPYTAYRCGYPIRQVSPSKPAAIFHEDVSGAAPAPKNLHLTIAGNASSSVVVQWSTEDATHATEVRFGDSPDALDKTAHGFSFLYGVADHREHEVHLCGLLPSHTYYYDAGGSMGRSAVHKFTTAPDGPSEVTLLVAGDTRSHPDVLANLATAALAKGATAWLTTGDAVATGSKQSQWDTLFEAAPDLFAELPGLWALGNHEDMAENYFAQLALPDHGGADHIEEWYAITYGALRVITLNDFFATQDVVTGTERTFLDLTLAAVDRTKTPFVATVHHTPMYTGSENHGPNTPLRGSWAPLYDKYHVNAVFNGHVHSYESTKALRGGTEDDDGEITTDALGTHYFVFGGGGADLYDFKDRPSYFVGQESTHGFAIVTVSATAMKWTAYRDDGSVIEMMSVTP
jgi:hypothetical protein